MALTARNSVEFQHFSQSTPKVRLFRSRGFSFALEPGPTSRARTLTEKKGPLWVSPLMQWTSALAKLTHSIRAKNSLGYDPRRTTKKRGHDPTS